MQDQPGIVRTSESENTYRELRLLYENAPEVYRDLMQEKQLDQLHRRRIEWAGSIAQMVGHVCGLIALAVLAIVAWHAFNLNDATQGAAVICTGAVSIVAVFVTGRLTASSTHPRIPRQIDEPIPESSQGESK